VASIEHWPPEKIRVRVEELIMLVGLDPEIMSRYPHQLSGGQRQRVGVARALAADPPILLMDEPFGALDPLTRSDLQREFLALQERLQKTVLFVTHDLHEALLLGTRIALLEQGRLVWLGSREEFLRSSEPLVAKYMEAFGTPLDQLRGKS
jgi:osmoprotectant transport system ATP-binding protein